MKVQQELRWLIADPTNPRALCHRVWPALQAGIFELDKEFPESWNLTENELQKLVKPRTLLRLLRLSLQYHIYNANLESRNKIFAKDVCTGFMGEDNWSIVCKDLSAVAYIIRPVPKLEAALEDTIMSGMNRLNDIIRLPLPTSPVKLRSHAYVVMSIMKELMHWRDQERVWISRQGAKVKKNAFKNELKRLGLDPSEKDETSAERPKVSLNEISFRDLETGQWGVDDGEKRFEDDEVEGAEEKTERDFFDGDDIFESTEGFEEAGGDSEDDELV